MKALITGGLGQLGSELKRSQPRGVEAIYVDVAELDITQPSLVCDFVTKFAPNVIINGAAYTAVDKAEQDSDLAYKINEGGVKNLAAAATASGARIVHISTDYVFSGVACQPYLPTDATQPLGVYGASKLAGELALRDAMPSSSSCVRTAWLYSAHGNNFVKSMLRLMASRDELGVVADQIGTPTWARGLADFLWALARRDDVSGLMHWTDAGVASWYDFAVAIYELGRELGLLERDVQIKPIRTADYPTPAKRPSYSVLDKTSTWDAMGIHGVHWRTQLRKMLVDMRDVANA